MKINLAYGEGQLSVELPDNVTVIEPSHRPGLADERAAMLDALDNPIGTASLRQQIKAHSKICIVFTDITRPTPNDRLIPWLLNYLEKCGAQRENILLLNALGSHLPNSREQLEKLLTPDVVCNYRVLNHEPENPHALRQVSTTRQGKPALLNRHLLEADVRIITGFIEPHFFAGFSGGPKGIMPGVAGLETIVSNHGRENIGSPHAAFGILDGNPIWEEMRDIALLAGPSFLLNVALNEAREITGVFAGDLIKAHRVGCEFVRASAMQKVDAPFDLVITTNSGYPLDQNLYQGVKGMSAAARIVKESGNIILAAQCRYGVPDGSPYDALLRRAQKPQDVFSLIENETFAEQWQAQIQALIQCRAEVHLFSELSDETTLAAHLNPCHSIEATVNENLENGASIAVLPQGPLTIPYLA
ncbi:MAG TPA: nickel-dependent lactate racemase [Abditibacteriaceae bacterium]|jgi:nickel-dependent lactate racemase